MRCLDAAYRFYGVDALITQVDYLKLDSCNNDAQGFPRGPAMGRASSRAATSCRCSWPAYIGDDESETVRRVEWLPLWRSRASVRVVVRPDDHEQG